MIPPARDSINESDTVTEDSESESEMHRTSRPRPRRRTQHGGSINNTGMSIWRRLQQPAQSELQSRAGLESGPASLSPVRAPYIVTATDWNWRHHDRLAQAQALAQSGSLTGTFQSKMDSDWTVTEVSQGDRRAMYQKSVTFHGLLSSSPGLP